MKINYIKQAAMFTFCMLFFFQAFSQSSGNVLSGTIEQRDLKMEYTIEGDFVVKKESHMIGEGNHTYNRMQMPHGGRISFSGTVSNLKKPSSNEHYNNQLHARLYYPAQSYLPTSLKGEKYENILVAPGQSKSFQVSYTMPNENIGWLTYYIRFQLSDKDKKNPMPKGGGVSIWFTTEISDKYVADNKAASNRNTNTQNQTKTTEKDDCTPSGVSISDLYGEVYIIPKNNPEDFYFAELNSKICIGDVIETRANSGVMLSLRDMTTYVLKSNSSVRIGDDDAKTSKIGILFGHVFANFNKMMQDGSMDIEMSQAVAGIKGTTLFISDDGKKSIVKVVKGRVEVKPKTGKTIVLNAEESVVIQNGRAANKQKFIVTKEQQTWSSKQKKWMEKAMGADYYIMLGWKSHNIGNLSFAIPPTWKYEKMNYDNQITHIFWTGKSLDNPTFGLSVEIVQDYAEEKAFFDSQKYSNIKISNKTVRKIENNEVMYLLFPKIGRTNTGVTFNFMSGNKTGFKKMDDIISTIKIIP